jgi:hypothetical protein
MTSTACLSLLLLLLQVVPNTKSRAALGELSDRPLGSQAA